MMYMLILDARSQVKGMTKTGCVRFWSIRNRIRYIKFRFRLIRTEIKFRKSGSGFLKPCSGRPLRLEDTHVIHSSKDLSGAKNP